MSKSIFIYLFAFLTLFNLIVCNIYKPAFFEEEEVRHVREDSPPKGPCNENMLIGFLAEAQITSPESIVGIAIADFDDACRSTSGLIKKIDKFFKNCTANPGLYTNLINGLRSFDEKLCKNNEFYKKYDSYDKCISDLDKDYDSCDGVADWMENDDKLKICRTYKKIIECYYIKTAKVCGIKAALILKDLMVEVMDCSLPTKCHVGPNPQVKDAMPDKYVASLNMGPSVIENIFIPNKIQQPLVVLLFYFVFT